MSAPWSRAQVRVVAACDVGAAALVIVCASAAGGDPLQDQILWLNVAVLSAVLAVLANGSLLLTARRAIGRRRLRLVPDVDSRFEDPEVIPAAAGDWYWTPGTARAHRAGCSMLEGRSRHQVVTAKVIKAEGLRRCELCG